MDDSEQCDHIHKYTQTSMGMMGRYLCGSSLPAAVMFQFRRPSTSGSTKATICAPRRVSPCTSPERVPSQLVIAVGVAVGTGVEITAVLGVGSTAVVKVDWVAVSEQ